MGIAESVIVILHVLLTVAGLFIAVFILRVYGHYRQLRINQSVMTPMLLAGIFVTLSGITELTESYFGEIGELAHAVAMLLAAVFFMYGIFGYHQMLHKAVKFGK